MNLYYIYETLRPVLLAAVPEAKVIEWFNNQYEGIIHATPAVFVEFPDELPMGQMGNGVDGADTIIRIHLVSKVLSGQDGQMNADNIREHFDGVKTIHSALRGWSHEGEVSCNSLLRVAMQHHPYNKGWLITTQDYSTSLYEQQD